MYNCMMVCASPRTEVSKDCVLGGCRCANTTQKMQHIMPLFQFILLRIMVCATIHYFIHFCCVILNYTASSLHPRQNIHSTVQLIEVLQMKILAQTQHTVKHIKVNYHQHYHHHCHSSLQQVLPSFKGWSQVCKMGITYLFIRLPEKNLLLFLVIDAILLNTNQC